MLTRDSILSAADTQTEDVDVPEWGGTVRVRGMTGSERDAFEQSLMVERGAARVMDTANIRAKVAVKCVIDGDGQRLFDDRDANELGGKSAAALDRVYDVASRLSGLREQDIAGRERDFTTASGSGSPTTSPNGSAAASVAS